MIKRENGITLVTLIITIVVIFIVAGTTVYTSLDRFEINRLQKMYNDIELLSNKVSSYYLKYNGLPVIKDSENNVAIEYTYTTLDFDKNVNDSGYYYIIDLSAMEGISLNYGEEGFNKPNESDDVYIINEVSHTIYYVKGIKVDGKMYYTIPKEENSINDTIPPTKPEIKIISGKTNDEGKYTTEVEIEIIPGKDQISGVKDTVYSINNGTEANIFTLENNIIKIAENGTYNIKIKTTDNNNNVSENTLEIELKIIKTAEDIRPKSDYGAVVTGYIPPIDEGKANLEDKAVKEWKIFYADNSNIYLIAANYIEAQYVPNKNEMEVGIGNTNYSFRLTNLLSEYNGSLDIKDERIKKLNISYFEQGLESTENNMKAVAYMLDTSKDVWGKYANDTYADYAIATPTLELLLASYNKKYNVEYKAKAISNIGYQISTTVDENGENVWEDTISNSSKNLNKEDSNYVIQDGSMWLASPSATGSHRLFRCVV